MEYKFFLSSMMGITDGLFCSQRSAGCDLVQLGAYLAEPSATEQDKQNQYRSFLPEDWTECTTFLALECKKAKQNQDVQVCLNLATPKLEWGIKAAESFQLAKGDYIELNVHGAYERYLQQGKLRAMILPENQSELISWLEAFKTLHIPFIVKFNGQFHRNHLMNTLLRIKFLKIDGIHINIRNAETKKPDLKFTKELRELHNGLLLVSGYVRSAVDAKMLFDAGADMVGIAEPTMKDAYYIEKIAEELSHTMQP